MMSLSWNVNTLTFQLFGPCLLWPNGHPSQLLLPLRNCSLTHSQLLLSTCLKLPGNGTHIFLVFFHHFQPHNNKQKRNQWAVFDVICYVAISSKHITRSCIHWQLATLTTKCKYVLYSDIILIRLIIRPHRSTTYVYAAFCYRPSSVVWRLSVGLSVMLVSPAKTAEPIEMPFGLWTRVGPRNHVLDGGPDFEGERGVPL